MDSRTMLITFEELLRNVNPDLEFDTNIDTDVVFTFLTRAQEEYITQNFLLGDNIVDNINSIRKRSDVLRNTIKRADIRTISSANQLDDGGYLATIDATDYWMFLSGVLINAGLPTNNKGSSITAVDFELLNHYDISKKIRTVNNEPVVKNIPIVLEGETEITGSKYGQFVFYLGKEYEDAIGGASIANSSCNIIYLAHPPAITTAQDCILAASTHNDIVKMAVNIFIREYKYSIQGIDPVKDNG